MIVLGLGAPFGAIGFFVFFIGSGLAEKGPTVIPRAALFVLTWSYVVRNNDIELSKQWMITHANGQKAQRGLYIVHMLHIFI